eukprot:gene9569-16740_t
MTATATLPPPKPVFCSRCTTTAAKVWALQTVLVLMATPTVGSRKALPHAKVPYANITCFKVLKIPKCQWNKKKFEKFRPNTRHHGVYADRFDRTVKIPLVTGAGRGGTHSVAYFLESLGVPAVHEVVREGSVLVSWWHAPDNAHTMPYGIGNYDNQSRIETYGAYFDPVIHVVRNPLPHIASLENCFCSRGNRTDEEGKTFDTLSYTFASRYVPMPSLRSSSRLYRAAVYWLEWNKISARKGAVRIRLEDVHGNEELLLKSLDVGALPSLKHQGYSSTDDFIARKFATSPNKEFGALGGISERRADQLTWKQLSEGVGPELAEVIRKQAVDWGYSEHDSEVARRDAASGIPYAKRGKKVVGKKHREIKY